MLIHVIGRPRRGKTSWVVAQIINNDLKYYNSRYYSAVKYIKNFNKAYNTNLTLPPERHVVSSNIDIYRKYPTMHSYPISGFDFGVPNKYHKTKRLIPYGVYVFDEAQKYFDSKGDKELPPWVTQAFELRGHIYLQIYCMTQRDVRLHKDIRDTVDKIVLIEESVHTFLVNGKKVKSKKFIDGKLLKTKFYGREFESYEELEAYRRGEKAGEKLKDDLFKGDIRDHYNPTNYAVVFENYDKDFNYYDYSNTFNEKPDSWKNYKKQPEKEKKNGKTK